MFLSFGSAFGASYEAWHPRNEGLTLSSLKGVAYGNGRFVAVGTEGTILVSANGMDWESRSSETNVPLNTVAFVQGRFFIGGSRGTILYSADTENWTNALVPVGHDITAIGFGTTTNDPAGRFMAGASTNKMFNSYESVILTSSNGLTWEMNYRFNSAQNFRIPGSITSVASGNHAFVASETSEAFNFSAIYSLQSFNSWFMVPGLPRGPAAFGNSRFVIVSPFWITDDGLKLSSTTSQDAREWSGGIGRNRIAMPSRSVCYGAGRFVVVGDGGSVGISDDGTNWITGSTDTDANLFSVAYGDGLYVAVGQSGVILSSQDGLNWVERSGRLSRNLNAVAPDGDGFVAVGTAGAIAASADGLHWTPIKAPPTHPLFDVRKVEDNYVIVGASGTILKGQELTNLVSQASGTSATLQALAYGNGAFVAVGAAGTILSSVDGANWRTNASTTTNQLNDIAYGNGTFATVGNGGTILTSSNGVEWVSRNSGTTVRLGRVTYGEGLFVAATSHSAFGPLAFTSRDGSAWTSHGDNIFGTSGVSYGNGVFIVSHATLPVLYSSFDGNQWIERTIHTNSPAPVNDFCFNNGTFIGVGYQGLIWQSDPIVRLRATQDSSFHITVDGPRNARYRIEALDSFGGTNTWREISTLSVPPYSWTDSLHGSQRFYRAVLVE